MLELAQESGHSRFRAHRRGGTTCAKNPETCRQWRWFLFAVFVQAHPRIRAVRFVSVDSILILREERTCVSIHDGRGKRRRESDSPSWSAAKERRFCSAKCNRTVFVVFLKVPVQAKIARNIPDGIRTLHSERYAVSAIDCQWRLCRDSRPPDFNS